MVSMENVLDYWTTITQELLSDSIYFTPEEITNILLDMGLIGMNEICHVEDLEKYIFLYGNEQEIYGVEERSFIECVGSVYIYNDINRKTNRGTIATKIFAADLSRFNDGVKSSFLFMKVINKANDGFNVFLFKTADGFYLGCRLYDKDVYKNCTLTEAIRTEIEYAEVMERLLYLPNTCEFIPFYSALVEAIQHRKAYLLDYDLKIKLKRGVNFSYLDMLSDVEKIYHISLEQAKEEYYESFEQKEIIPRDEECISIIEGLKFIKSNRANTLEILFEAEEMELLANQAEAENDEVKQKTYEIADTDTPMEEEIKQYLNDPEMMIRMLKEKKGI